jgi:hypothetical protein
MRKTKTKQLADKLKKGTKIWALIPGYNLTPKYRDGLSVGILLHLKEIDIRKVDYTVEKSISLNAKLEPKGKIYKFHFSDALNELFFNKDKALKRWKRWLRGHKTWHLKQLNDINKLLGDADG